MWKGKPVIGTIAGEDTILVITSDARRARALVKRPELYIFDDSFSSLDTATDARLRQALTRRDRLASEPAGARKAS